MPTLKFALADDGIAVVTLAHPPVNAMDAHLLEELANLFEGLVLTAQQAAVIGRWTCVRPARSQERARSRSIKRRLIDALNEAFGTSCSRGRWSPRHRPCHAGADPALCADWRPWPSRCR
jgi:hypothetical protein